MHIFYISLMTIIIDVSPTYTIPTTNETIIAQEREKSSETDKREKSFVQMFARKLQKILIALD